MASICLPLIVSHFLRIREFRVANFPAGGAAERLKQLFSSCIVFQYVGFVVCLRRNHTRVWGSSKDSQSMRKSQFIERQTFLKGKVDAPPLPPSVPTCEAAVRSNTTNHIRLFTFLNRHSLFHRKRIMIFRGNNLMPQGEDIQQG